MDALLRSSGVVALVGRPNAGKSTLFNKLVRMPLAAVTPKPNTTRDRMLGCVDQVGDAELVLMDAPGILGGAPVSRVRSGRALDRYLEKQIARALEEPDLIWWLIPAQSTMVGLAPAVEKLKTVRLPVVVVRTMCDRLRPSQKPSEIVLPFAPVATFEISAETGQGLDALVQDALARFPKRHPEDRIWPDREQVSDRPMRYFVSEIIRKHVVLQLQDELPYVTAVQLTSFKEGDGRPGSVRIEADIIVERDSQKALVIGHQGARIRSIGMAARAEIESLMEQPKIFLGLRVVVRPQWTHRPGSTQHLGYGLHG
jgi:GTP-binding protein Era